jgi:hypothetical protein
MYMKSEGLQKFVKKIFSDEKTRKEFESNPDKVLSRYNLTEQEKKAVLTTNAKVGLATSNSSALVATLKATETWWAPEP